MENKLYVGRLGTGKTNKIKEEILNKINNNESMIILDTKDEYSNMFDNSNYEVIKFSLNDFENSIGYNLIYRIECLYNDGNIDDAIELVEYIGNIIFKTVDAVDPFWDNSAKNLFISIVLYLLENKKHLNMKEILAVSLNEMDDFIKYVNDQDILKTISILGTPIIKAPTETRGGILSVFNQKMGLFAYRPNLLELICTNNKIEYKDKNQVIIFSNKDMKCFPNTILEIVMLDIIKDILGKKIKYNFIFDNFDTIMNSYLYLDIINVCNNYNVSTIVCVRDINLINNKDVFDIINM